MRTLLSILLLLTILPAPAAQIALPEAVPVTVEIRAVNVGQIDAGEVLDETRTLVIPFSVDRQALVETNGVRVAVSAQLSGTVTLSRAEIAAAVQAGEDGTRKADSFRATERAAIRKVMDALPLLKAQLEAKDAPTPTR